MLSMNMSFSGDNYFHSNFLAFQLLLDKAFIKMTGKDPPTYEVCPVIVHQKINAHFNLYFSFISLVFCPSESLCKINNYIVYVN